MLDARLVIPLSALRFVLGAQAIGFGVQRWQQPGAPAHLAGLLELVAGVLVFTPLTELAARFLAGWLFLLALAAVLPGGSGLGLTNVLLAASAFTLARLTRVNQGEAVEGADGVARARAA
jgi:hypothetical protein